MTRAALTVLVLLLVVPAAAQATVVPQQGMKGARLGMTVDEVVDRVGEPTRSTLVDHEIMGRVRELRYGLTVFTFNGRGETAELITTSTTSRSERLANDIGIGSTRAAVDRRVPRTRCRVEFGFDHCFIGTFRAGRVVTDFHISKAGRVKRIVVGRVID